MIICLMFCYMIYDIIIIISLRSLLLSSIFIKLIFDNCLEYMFIKNWSILLFSENCLEYMFSENWYILLFSENWYILLFSENCLDYYLLRIDIFYCLVRIA